MFIDSFKKSFTLSFDFRSTDGKTFDTQLDHQVDIRSAESTNNPKYLIVAHQTADRICVPQKKQTKTNFWQSECSVKTIWRFLSHDNGKMAGTHCVCLLVRDKISCYFNSFGGSLDNF